MQLVRVLWMKATILSDEMYSWLTQDFLMMRRVVLCRVACCEGYEIERRYSDFKWLRSALARQFPGVTMPALPPATNLVRNIHL